MCIHETETLTNVFIMLIILCLFYLCTALPPNCLKNSVNNNINFSDASEDHLFLPFIPDIPT